MFGWLEAFNLESLSVRRNWLCIDMEAKMKDKKSTVNRTCECYVNNDNKSYKNKFISTVVVYGLIFQWHGPRQQDDQCKNLLSRYYLVIGDIGIKFVSS